MHNTAEIKLDKIVKFSVRNVYLYDLLKHIYKKDDHIDNKYKNFIL